MDFLGLLLKFLNNKIYNEIIDAYDGLAKNYPRGLAKYIKERGISSSNLTFKIKDKIVADINTIKRYDIHIQFDNLCKSCTSTIEFYAGKTLSSLNENDINDVVSNQTLIKKIQKVYPNSFKDDFPLIYAFLSNRYSKKKYLRTIVNNKEGIILTEKYIKLTSLYSENAVKTIIQNDLPKIDDFSAEGLALKEKLINYDSLNSQYNKQAISRKRIADSYKDILVLLNLPRVHDDFDGVYHMIKELSIFEVYQIIVQTYKKFENLTSLHNLQEKNIFHFVYRNKVHILNYYRENNKKEKITFDTYFSVIDKFDTIQLYINSEVTKRRAKKIIDTYTFAYNLLVAEKLLEVYTNNVQSANYIISNEEKIVQAGRIVEQACSLMEKYAKAYQILINKGVLTEKNTSINSYRNIILREKDLCDIDLQLKEKEKKEKEEFARKQKEKEELLAKERERVEINNLKNCVSNWYTHQWNGSVKHIWYCDYYSYQTHKEVATFSMWDTWHLIWNFKNSPEKNISAYEHSKALNIAIEWVEQTLKKTFLEDTIKLTLVCLTASTKEKNDRRFKDFAQKVCDDLKMCNAYDHIHIVSNGEAKHEGGTISVKKLYDKDWFNNKKIVLFDDVRTSGLSIENEKEILESFGATVICAVTLGQTVHS